MGEFWGREDERDLPQVNRFVFWILGTTRYKKTGIKLGPRLSGVSRTMDEGGLGTSGGAQHSIGSASEVCGEKFTIRRPDAGTWVDRRAARAATDDAVRTQRGIRRVLGGAGTPGMAVSACGSGGREREHRFRGWGDATSPPHTHTQTHTPHTRTYTRHAQRARRFGADGCGSSPHEVGVRSRTLGRSRVRSRAIVYKMRSPKCHL